MAATQTPPSQQAERQLNEGKQELNRAAADAKNAAGDAADSASAAASNAAGQASAAVSDAARQAKMRAGELYDSAAQTAYAKAGEARSAVRQKVAEYTATGKQKASGEVNTYGAAIAKAAEELEKNDEPTAPLVRTAAEKVQQFGRYLENRDTGDLLDAAEDYARRHPEIVLGGMFVLGLGLARFFKSTREPLPVRTTAYRPGRGQAGYRQPGRTGGTTDTRFAGSRYDGNYSTGNYAAGRTAAPPRLTNPSHTGGGGVQTGGGSVTVLEETTTVVPSTPK